MTRFCFLALLLLGVSTANVSADVIFDDSFGGFADQGLNDLGNWQAQNGWTISSGSATNAGTDFHRARRFGLFRVEDTESVQITLSGLVVSGAGSGSNNLFAFGFAKSNEHTGTVTPQVRSELQFNGSSLSIGGASDTGYDSGDSVDLTLTFNRTASAWDVDTLISNTTDGTSFTGSDASPTDLAGTVTTQTVAEWLDASASNQLHFGMRATGNFGNTISIGGVRLETLTASAVPEPGSFGILAAGLMGVAVRRYRRSKKRS